jgi:hypothetical protein
MGMIKSFKESFDDIERIFLEFFLPWRIQSKLMWIEYVLTWKNILPLGHG